MLREVRRVHGGLPHGGGARGLDGAHSAEHGHTAQHLQEHIKLLRLYQTLNDRRKIKNSVYTYFFKVHAKLYASFNDH